jgi:hypothetical protein
VVAGRAVLVTVVADGPVPPEYLPTTDFQRRDASAPPTGGDTDRSRLAEVNVVFDCLRFIETSLSKLAGYSSEAISKMLLGRWTMGSKGSTYNTAWTRWIKFVYSSGFRCCFFPRSLVANFLAHVDAENEKQTKLAKAAVSLARSAITVTEMNHFRSLSQPTGSEQDLSATGFVRATELPIKLELYQLKRKLHALQERHTEALSRILELEGRAHDSAAFEVGLLAQAGGKLQPVAPGTIGNMQYYVVLNSQLTTKAPSSFPVHGPDYTVAYDFWI